MVDVSIPPPEEQNGQHTPKEAYVILQSMKGHKRAAAIETTA